MKRVRQGFNRGKSNIFKLIMISSLLILFSGCGRDLEVHVSESETGTTNYTKGSATLNDGITSLDTSATSQITASDGTSVTFSGSPSAITALKPGDIFIVNDEARKVESVTSSGGQTIVKTTEPDFSEVVNALEIEGDVWLTEEHIAASSSSSKLRFSTKRSKSKKSLSINTDTGDVEGKSFYCPIEDVVIYDSDGDEDTTSDQVIANGEVVIEKPRVRFKFKYGKGNDYTSLYLYAKEDFNLSLSSEAVSFNKEVSIPLGDGFVIPIAVTGGTVYVKIPVNLVFSANGTAKIVVDVSQKLTIDTKIEAALGPVSITTTDNSDFDFDFENPQIDGEVTGSIAVNPDVDLTFLQWELAGINNSLGIKATAKANLTSANTCYRITADADASSTAYVMVPKASLNLGFLWDDDDSSLLDFDMEEYPKELFTKTWPLYDSGEQCAVTYEAPVANAGADVISNTNATVLLDGTGSYDNDGTIASYQWTQTAGTQVALMDSDTATPSFTAPATADTLSFQLTVTDNNGSTATDTVTISVMTGDSNYRPTANAGSDQAVIGGSMVYLDGSGSSDSDGSIASYAWTQTGGTSVTLTNSNTTTPSFTAPNNTDTLTFKLTVTDDKGATATDYVQVFVTGIPAYSDPTDTTTTGITITVPTIDTSGGSDNIQMYASVVIQDGMPLENLIVGNFTLEETINGVTQTVPISSVTTSSSSGSSISTALVLDVSGSMTGSIDDLKTAAKSFINNMKDNDYAAIIQFDSTVDTLQNFTNDKAALTSAIVSISGGGGTYLYEAINDAVALTASQSGQKAIVAMTDGQSATSSHSKDDVINYAVSEGIPIYTVGLGSGINEAVLEEISDSTNAGSNGSGYYSTPDSSELTELYNKISSVLSNVYILGWSSDGSSGDNVSVKITVTYTGANGTFTKSFTSSYVAP